VFPVLSIPGIRDPTSVQPERYGVFDVGELSAGVYLVQVLSEGITLHGKMVLREKGNARASG